MKKQKKGRLRSVLADQSGTTMVEMLVAVVVILLMVTMFSGTVSQAADFMGKSYEIQDRVSCFNHEYYKKTAFAQRKDPANCCALSVALKLDTEKTVEVTDAATTLNLKNTRLHKYEAVEETSAKGMNMYSFQIQE